MNSYQFEGQARQEQMKPSFLSISKKTDKNTDLINM